MEALTRLAGYLKGHYQPIKLRTPDELRVKGPVDTTWGTDPNNRKRVNALLLTLGGCSIDWTSKKQRSIAKSSSEAEYVGTSHGGSGVKFTNMLVREICGKVVTPSILGVDNTGAIFMAKNIMAGPRTKHIDIHYHFIKDMIRDGELELCYVRTDLNTADILTKNTPEATHTKHAKDIYEGTYANKLKTASVKSPETVYCILPPQRESVGTYDSSTIGVGTNPSPIRSWTEVLTDVRTEGRTNGRRTNVTRVTPPRYLTGLRCSGLRADSNSHERERNQTVVSLTVKGIGW